MTRQSFRKIYLSLYLKGFEKGYSKFYCERELETEQNCNILAPTLMAIGVVSFSFSRPAQPEACGPTLLSAGFFFHILSPMGLVSKLVSKLTVFTELYNSSITHSISPHNWPSGMCHFRCPWNGMFDCHWVEITVMQFTGHSLPVHQIDCTVGFYLVPYCQPSLPTPMEYATSAPLEWHVWPGRRSIYNMCTLTGKQ